MRDWPKGVPLPPPDVDTPLGGRWFPLTAMALTAHSALYGPAYIDDVWRQRAAEQAAGNVERRKRYEAAFDWRSNAA